MHSIPTARNPSSLSSLLPLSLCAPQQDPSSKVPGPYSHSALSPLSLRARFFYPPNPFYAPRPLLARDRTSTYEPLNDLTPRVINHPDQLPRCAAVKGIDRHVRSDFFPFSFFLRRAMQSRTMRIDINRPVMAFIAAFIEVRWKINAFTCER